MTDPVEPKRFRWDVAAHVSLPQIQLVKERCRRSENSRQKTDTPETAPQAQSNRPAAAIPAASVEARIYSSTRPLSTPAGNFFLSSFPQPISGEIDRQNFESGSRNRPERSPKKRRKTLFIGAFGGIQACFPQFHEILGRAPVSEDRGRKPPGRFSLKASAGGQALTRRCNPAAPQPPARRARSCA
jgi:hypothetical protein